MKEVYGKKDIMDLLGCESDKALKFLKLLYNNDIAIKIGKEYYVTGKELFDYLDEMQGQEISI